MSKKIKVLSKKHSENSDYYRGLVLSNFIALEDRVSQCLAEYFLRDSTDDWLFMRVVLDRMTFESKRAALKYLVELIEVKKGFIKTKNNSYPCKEFFNELRLLNDQRNYFAHYASFSPIGIDEEFDLTLLENRDSSKIYSYRKDDIEKLLNRIMKANEDLINLWESVSEKSTEALLDKD